MKQLSNVSCGFGASQNLGNSVKKQPNGVSRVFQAWTLGVLSPAESLHYEITKRCVFRRQGVSNERHYSATVFESLDFALCKQETIKIGILWPFLPRVSLFFFLKMSLRSHTTLWLCSAKRLE